MHRSLSIVIPAFNEEGRLPATIERVISYCRRGGWEFAEVLIVDDGSTDRTREVAEPYLKSVRPVVRVIPNDGNRGKGYSVRHGVGEAKGEWVLFTDADLSAPIEEVERLWQAAMEQRATVAFGSRALDRSLIGVSQPFVRQFVGRVFNVVARLITGLAFEDTQCGFKLFRVDVARQIFGMQLLDRFGFDVEVLFLARKLRYKIVEVPVRWNDVRGTKVGLMSGLVAFGDPFRVRWYDWSGHYQYQPGSIRPKRLPQGAPFKGAVHWRRK